MDITGLKPAGRRVLADSDRRRHFSKRVMCWGLLLRGHPFRAAKYMFGRI